MPHIVGYMYSDGYIEEADDDDDVSGRGGKRRRRRRRRRERRGGRRGERRGSRGAARRGGGDGDSAEERAGRSLDGAIEASEDRDQVLPLSAFTRVDVNAGTDGSLTGRAQKAIQGSELLLSSPVGLNQWQVTDLDVGVRRQQAGLGIMTAEAFAAVGTFRSSLEFSPTPAGVDVVIGVRHIGASFPATITGQLNGLAAR